MHLWQNPSHSDLQTYRSRRGRIGRLLEYFRSNYTITSPSPASPSPASPSPESQPSHIQQQDLETKSSTQPSATSVHPSPPSEQENQGPRSSYVFLRTPRKLGEQLQPDDADPPEAWGLYFEEGFRVHHFFILILFIYILASLAFAIYWCAKFGFVGPKTGSEAFGVASWMVTLVSLVTTVWFKWAD